MADVSLYKYKYYKYSTYSKNYTEGKKCSGYLLGKWLYMEVKVREQGTFRAHRAEIVESTMFFPYIIHSYGDLFAKKDDNLVKLQLSVKNTFFY